MKIRTFLCSLWVALSLSLMAQSPSSVRIIINILPPFSYYPQDYINQPDKIQVILQSMEVPGGEPHRIRFTASMTGDNGVQIRTRQNYQPLGPYILQKGESKLLTYDEVSEIFTFDHFEFINTSKNALMRNGLPEGNYTFCVRAFDFDNGTPLSDEEPMGCSNPVPVVFLEPPQIIIPDHLEVLDVQVAANQTFSWTPVVGSPVPCSYMLKIIELPDINADVNALMNSSSIPYFLQENIPVPSYTRTPADPPLESGKTYACQVIAYDPQNQLKFINDGRSVPHVFTIGAPVSTAEPELIIIAPYLSGTGHLRDSVSAAVLSRLNDTIEKYKNKVFSFELGPDDFMLLAWTWADITQNQNPGMQYKISFYELPSGQSLSNQNVLPQSGVFMFSETSQAPLLRFYQPFSKCLELGFKPGRKYGFVVQAVDLATQQVQAEITGRNFIFTQGVAQEKGPVLKGRLRYVYEGEGNTYPVSNVMMVVRTTQPGIYAIGYTNQEGEFFVQVPKTTADSIRVNLELKSPYYKPLDMQLWAKTSMDTVSVGDITTSVYSYSLRLELEKVYESYQIPQTNTSIPAEPEKKPPLANHYVALYRKGKPKPAFLPVREGMQDATGHVNGMYGLIQYQHTAVAWAKTTVEYSGGKVKSNYVKFDRLPLNLMNGDEYAIVVFDSTGYNEVTEVQTFRFIPNEFGLTNSLNLQINSVFTGTGGAGTAVYQGIGASGNVLINTNLQFQQGGNNISQLQAQNPIGQGAQVNNFMSILDSLVNVSYHYWSKLHYDVRDTLIIHAQEPPKSKIAGRIMYRWPGENLSRPMPNAPFKIVVDYVFTVNGKSLALKEAQQHYNGKLPDPPADLEMTAGTGKTNANGEFSVDVINLNKKGIVDTSYLYIMENNHLTGTLKRVYRIQFSNSLRRYYYAPCEDILVQPYESVQAGNLMAVVREAKIKVSVSDVTNPGRSLPGILLIAFKEKIDPLAPSDQGNCNYLKKKLIKPVFGNYTYDNAAFLEQEYYWIDSAFTSTENTATLPKLLMENNSYYLQVVTNPNDNTLFYKMRIENLRGYSYKGVKTIGGSIQTNPNQPAGYMTQTDDDFIVSINCPGYTNQNKSEIELVYWNEELYGMIDYTHYKICLDPLPPRIGGKLVDSQSRKGIQGGFTSLIFNNSLIIPWKISDANGKFEYLIPSSANLPESVNFNLKISKKGYKSDEKSGMMPRSGSQYALEFLLQPDALVKGGITDESGKPLAAYIQVGNGDIRDNQMPLGWFFYYTASGDNQKLIIIPHDPAYFNDTLTINIPENGVLNVGSIKLYKRKHRMRFDVADADTKAPIAGASVTLIDKELSKVTTMPSSGFEYRASATFVFENVSVNNYRISISGPRGKGYIRKEFNLQNPESIDTLVYKIYLKVGKTLSGIVRLDGQPVKGARIYVDQSSFGASIPDSLPELSTTSLANGSFTLTGIPLKFGQSVKLFATLDTTFTVIGDAKTISLNFQQAGLQNIVFNLKKFRKMNLNEVLGFPFSVETLAVLNADSTRVKVSGKLDLAGGASLFTWIDPANALVRIRDVELQRDPSDGKGKPVQDEIDIPGVNSIRMQFASKMYNVLVHAPSSSNIINGHIFYFPENLTIKKSGANGQVNGLTRIVDNSFNFPSTYLNFPNGEFYFKGGEDNKLRALWSGSGSLMQGLQPSSFSLSTQQGRSIWFKLLGFNAKADSIKSTINASTGAISLDVKVLCKFPQATPDTFSLYIPGLRIDNNALHSYTSATPLIFNLETWKIEVKNWKFKPDEGGIYASDQEGSSCVVKTNAINIPFGKFVLRPDLFFFDEFKMNQLTIGAGITLPIHPEAVPKLFFDPSCGIDQGGHWKLSILVPQGNVAAATVSLPDVLSGTIKVEYINLLSNNEKMIGIKREANILKNVCVYIPQTFYSGPDYFALSGELDLKTPRIHPIAAELIVKNNNGSLSAALNPLNISFEGKGYVLFEAKNRKPEISDKHFALKGTLREPGVVDTISSTLLIDGFYQLFNEQRYKRVETLENFMYPLNAKHTLKLKKEFALTKFNGMKVVGNDWNLLSFSGEILGDSTLIDQGKTTKMTFTVRGDVDVNPDEMKVKDVPFTPPGTTFRYIFSEKRVVGAMSVDMSLFGPVKVKGALEISVGSPGWYFAGAGEARGMPNPVGSFATGFLIGMTSNLPESAKKTATQFSPAMPCQLANATELKGFYFSGKKIFDNIVPDLNVDVNLGVVAFYVRTQLPAIDAAVFADFSDGFQATLSCGLTSGIEVGMSSITCTDLTGGARVAGRVTSAVGGGDFQLNGNVCSSLSLSFTQGIPIPFNGCETIFSLNKTIGVDVSLKLGSIANELKMSILDEPCPTNSCF